jgi:hypothetical protein
VITSRVLHGASPANISSTRHHWILIYMCNAYLLNEISVTDYTTKRKLYNYVSTLDTRVEPDQGYPRVQVGTVVMINGNEELE